MWAQDLSLEAYSIQVFSSKDKLESKKVGLDFVSIDNPFILPAIVNQEKWFRVYVGLYESREEAKKVLKLIRLKRKDAFIMRLIN